MSDQKKGITNRDLAEEMIRAKMQSDAPEATEIPGAHLPSILSNRFNVTVGPHLTRFAFGEAVVGTAATYHLAVSMSTVDAKELAELILKLVKTVEAKG